MKHKDGFIAGCFCLFIAIVIAVYVVFFSDHNNNKYIPDEEYTFVNQHITWNGAGYSGVYSNTKGGYYGR